MPNPNFEQLCESFCDFAAMPAPDLRPDRSGNTALAVTVDDVEIHLSHEPEVAPGDALLEVAFGPLPSEEALAVCRALMDVNSLMLWNRACSFCRDPVTRQILLQYVYPLADASGPLLYAHVREVASVVQDWREHRFLETSGNSPVSDLMTPH